MKPLWALNSGLWFINALAWSLYTHAPVMGGLSFVASILFAVLAKKMDDYDWLGRDRWGY